MQQFVYHHRHIRDIEHLKEVLQTCWEQIGQDVINQYDSFANDCRSLLQPVEDILSTTLASVFGATRTLPYLRDLLLKRTWKTEVNSPVYSVPPCRLSA